MGFAEFKNALKTYSGTVTATLGADSFSFPASDIQTALGIPVPPAEGNYGIFRVKIDGSASPWLNVRSSPNGTILDKVYPGNVVTKILPNLEIVGTRSWGKIRAGTVVGWVAWDLVEPIPTSKNKIGLQLMGFVSDNDIMKAIAQNASVYKAVDAAPELKRIMEARPNATYIFRRYQGSEDDPVVYIQQHGGIDGAVAAWLASMSGLFAQLPASVYFESFNEKKAPKEYLAFEAARARAMYKMGRRACLLNIATGQTERETWVDAKDMVQAAIDTGSIIGIHGYSQTVLSSGYSSSYWANGQWNGSLFPTPNRTDDPNSPPVAYHSCRFERDMWHLRKQGQGAARLVLTENLLDDMLDPRGYPAEGQTKGWNDGRCETVWRNRGWVGSNKTKEQFLREQIAWQNDVMNREPQLIGACIYTFGVSQDPQWRAFEVQSAL